MWAAPAPATRREGTLGVIRAIEDNQGPLEAVRLENTTSAGMEYEAVCEAQAVLAKRIRWVEVLKVYTVWVTP